MNRTAAWAAAVAAGPALGGATFAGLVDDAALAGATAAFWTLGVGLSLDHNSAVMWSTGDGGARWSAAFGGLVVLAGAVGLGPTLPVSGELRLALGLFVVGVALAMVNVGVGLGRAGGEPPADG